MKLIPRWRNGANTANGYVPYWHKPVAERRLSEGGKRIHDSVMDTLLALWLAEKDYHNDMYDMDSEWYDSFFAPGEKHDPYMTDEERKKALRDVYTEKLKSKKVVNTPKNQHGNKKDLLVSEPLGDEGPSLNFTFENNNLFVRPKGLKQRASLTSHASMDFIRPGTGNYSTTLSLPWLRNPRQRFEDYIGMDLPTYDRAYAQAVDHFGQDYMAYDKDLDMPINVTLLTGSKSLPGVYDDRDVIAAHSRLDYHTPKWGLKKDKDIEAAENDLNTRYTNIEEIGHKKAFDPELGTKVPEPEYREEIKNAVNAGFRKFPVADLDLLKAEAEAERALRKTIINHRNLFAPHDIALRKEKLMRDVIGDYAFDPNSAAQAYVNALGKPVYNFSYSDDRRLAPENARFLDGKYFPTGIKTYTTGLSTFYSPIPLDRWSLALRWGWRHRPTDTPEEYIEYEDDSSTDIWPISPYGLYVNVPEDSSIAIEGKQPEGTGEIKDKGKDQYRRNGVIIK